MKILFFLRASGFQLKCHSISRSVACYVALSLVAQLLVLKTYFYHRIHV